MKKTDPRGVIVALSYSSEVGSTLEFVERVKPHVWGFKIHPNTDSRFTREGHDVVGYIKDIGGRVFYDGKYHDIPSEVGEWIKADRDRGIDMGSVHASGGPAMMDSAAVASGGELTVLAITILTSINEHACQKIYGTRDIPAKVRDLAEQAYDAGCHGIVCSPHETRGLRGGEWSRRTPEIVVNPGIRPLGANEQDDQARVATPKMARDAGANFIVVGRPIRNADDPVAVAKSISEEFLGGN